METGMKMKIAVAGATGRVGRHVVEVLEERGHEVVPISRSKGVDVITGEGLAQALEGVAVIIDTATGPSPDGHAATEFFTTAARNLEEAGQKAGVRLIVVVSIIGSDRFTGGYGRATMAHERAYQDGPIPVRILRASQFFEFIPQMVEWGTQGNVAYMPRMRAQPVAARTVAEALADLATEPETTPAGTAAPVREIAGPREEDVIELAKLFVARRGDALKVEGVTDPSDPATEVYQSGALLPGPDAISAGPTFREWLESNA
jgi:uncharacterized protein YbjT (DUF2867 family)